MTGPPRFTIYVKCKGEGCMSMFTLSQEENIAKVAGATSGEGFLVGQYTDHHYNFMTVPCCWVHTWQ